VLIKWVIVEDIYIRVTLGGSGFGGRGRVGGSREDMEQKTWR
jgi:hypothetical protein